ncbi:MAG: PD-(D/E)XK nuclease family protein, partial [Acidimicrobiaceae bacterium]|nr:PD-(D/E)XK nuclease family protein [Acidimicrobiaceae bacterium]
MTIACVTTAYGAAAHEALATAVARAKDRDPLAPVTVVVPNHYVGLAARRALGRRSHNGTRGVAAVAFHTAYDLAERLGGAEMAAEGRRGVTMTVIAAAVRTVLRRDPGHFRGVETHPATERALTRAHRELSELEGGQLRALAAQSPRAADVVRIHRQ